MKSISIALTLVAASGLNAQTTNGIITNQHYNTNPLPVSTPYYSHGTTTLGGTWMTLETQEAEVKCSPGGTTGKAYAFSVWHGATNATAFDWLDAKWSIDFGTPGYHSGHSSLTAGGTIDLAADAAADAAGYLWGEHECTIGLAQGKPTTHVYVEGGVDTESGNVPLGTLQIGVGPLSWTFSPTWSPNVNTGSFPITSGGQDDSGKPREGKLSDNGDCYEYHKSKVTLEIKTVGFVHAYADGLTLGGFDWEAECTVNLKTTCAVKIDGSAIDLAQLPTSSGKGTGKGQGH